ncbi:MAG: V-type ATP synthase subunit B, partial [Rubripirellula sp.]
LYSGAQDASKKQAMAFDLSPFDHKLLKFGKLFRSRFMSLDVSRRLLSALDLGWQTLAECFEPEELLMKQTLVDKYYPVKQGTPSVRSEPAENPMSGDVQKES